MNVVANTPYLSPGPGIMFTGLGDESGTAISSAEWGPYVCMGDIYA
ncbi:hypothetical protein DR64_1239 [Paraburkholderia xenovorans LB400]|nr:hypothetical protein DR64_1239 [Paraburkholderia xenovorans LB400]